MLDAIKRAIIVIIGVILQFGFSILLRFFFKEHIMFVGVIYWLIGVLIVLWIIMSLVRQFVEPKIVSRKHRNTSDIYYSRNVYRI